MVQQNPWKNKTFPQHEHGPGSKSAEVTQTCEAGLGELCVLERSWLFLTNFDLICQCDNRLVFWVNLLANLDCTSSLRASLTSLINPWVWVVPMGDTRWQSTSLPRYASISVSHFTSRSKFPTKTMRMFIVHCGPFIVPPVFLVSKHSLFCWRPSPVLKPKRPNASSVTSAAAPPQYMIDCKLIVAYSWLPIVEWLIMLNDNDWMNHDQSSIMFNNVHQSSIIMINHVVININHDQSSNNVHQSSKIFLRNIQ